MGLTIMYNYYREVKSVQKKQNILLVLKILETESDKLHPIKQCEIAKIISRVYPCDRKTVGRNIKFLMDIGYPIVKTTQGVYLDKKLFTMEERALILSAVNRLKMAETQKTNLILRITTVLDKLYR